VARVSFFGDEIEEITEFDPLTGKKIANLDYVRVFREQPLCDAGPDAETGDGGDPARTVRTAEGTGSRGPLLEAQRLEQRTNFDLEMIAATGSCAGIENYSALPDRPPAGRAAADLFEYLPDNALLFVDESHQTIPQIGAMSKGDHRRKITLAEYGFRLPSCIDNRPLRFATNGT
jgi:excinuclease ABC subunit B